MTDQPAPTDPAPTDKVGGRTAIGAGWLMAWRLVTRGLGLLSTLVLARILVPADFGLIAMATTFSNALEMLSRVSVLDALVRRPDTGQSWYSTTFTFQVTRYAVTSLIIFLGAPWVADWFNEPRLVDILRVLAAITMCSGLENIGQVEFRRKLQFSMEFKLLFLPRILQFATTLSLALLMRSYWALIAGIGVSAVSRLILTYVVHPWRPSFSIRHWRDLWEFSFWSWAGNVATMAWERCDVFIVAPAMGTAKFGVYLVAQEIAVLPITEIVTPAMRALYAGLSVARSQGTPIVSLALEVAAALLTLVVPLTIGVSATAGYIVAGMLGPNWEAARPMIATFAWLCCMSPVSGVCSAFLNAQGQVRRNFLAVAGAASAKAVVMVAVVQSGRIDLAPLAVVLSVAVESLMFLTQLHGHGDARWKQNRGGFLRIGAAALVTVGLLHVTGLGWQHVDLPPVQALLVGGAIGLGAVVTYVAVQLALWAAVGRPAGPEKRLIGVVGGALSLAVPRLLARAR